MEEKINFILTEIKGINQKLTKHDEQFKLINIKQCMEKLGIMLQIPCGLLFVIFLNSTLFAKI